MLFVCKHFPTKVVLKIDKKRPCSPTQLQIRVVNTSCIPYKGSEETIFGGSMGANEPANL